MARQLLGAHFAGVLTTDRWSAYEWVDAGLRQLCWAHLSRDIQGFIDRGGKGGRIGRELMRERNRFFRWYHRVRFTATITLKLQGCDVLAFLSETLAAHRRGLRGPSLLPSDPVPKLALAA